MWLVFAVQISQMAEEELEKVSLSFFHRALVAHGEVVTSGSCHSDRPVWRYATLCVLSKMYRKLLFNNLSIVWNVKILLIAFCHLTFVTDLSIVWNVKILLISFCQQRQQIMCAKFGANQLKNVGL